MNLPRPNSPLPWYFKALLLAAAYAVAARLSLGLAFEASNASPIWPPSGIAFAALLLGGRRLAPGVFVGALIANLFVFIGNGAAMGTAIGASIAIGLGNTAEAWVAAGLARRLIRGPMLGTPQGAYIFVAVALAASVIAASCGVSTLVGLAIVPRSVVPTVWLTWWLGDATGLLVVAPAMIQLWALRHWRPGLLAAKRLLPTLALLVIVGGLCFGGAFADGHVDRLLSCLLIGFVAWSAYRHGPPGAALSLLAVASPAVYATLHGQGPFAKATTNDSLISLDVFLALCALTGMVLSTTLHARGTSGQPAQAPRGGHVPTAILLCCLAGSVLAWHLISLDTERRAADRFAALCTDLQGDVLERMNIYEQALHGGRGLFDASRSVERDEWHHYAGSLAIDQRYPGRQAIGYAAQVAASELPSFLARARADGLPGFAIWPAGERPQYTGVLYAEPMNERNRRAVGFDLASEPMRRAALEQARDTAQTSMTGKITLKQETDQDVQSGFLMFVPVYRHDMPVETVMQRRAALEGFVYSPFRMGDLIRGILKPAYLQSALISIYDGAGTDASALMFTNAGPHPDQYPHQLATVLPLAIAGHRWTLAMRSTHGFEASVDTQKAQITLVAGAIISLLIFTVVRSLTLTRQDALALARRMAEAHTEAQTRFQSLAESASEGILVVDSEGRIEFCNRAAAQLFSCAAPEMAGRDIHELLMLPLSFVDWQATPLLGPAGVLTTVARASDDTSIPVDVSLGAWSGAEGRYFSLIVHDISERTTAEAALRRAKSNLRGIVDNIPALVASWDARLLNRFCNLEYLNWFGIEPQAAVGRHMRDVLGEAAYRLNLPFVTRALEGEKQSFERVMLCADGRTRHAQGYYVPDIQDGVVQGVFVLVFDITKQKEVEQALQYEVRLHDVIFRHAGVGIASTRDRKFERVSRCCTELLGYEEGELDGQPGAAIYPDDDTYAQVGELARELLPAGKTLDHELSLRRKDGSTVWCRLMGRAVDPADPSQGTIWIIDDFSDRKQRETLINEARAAAEDGVRLKANFLANMSHEIRTPMNGIMGMTRLTLDTELDETQRENLLIVQDSADALLRLLDDILDFSKMEAGKLQLAPADFDLRARIATTLDTLAPMAAAKGLELVLDVAPDVPERVCGDAGRLMQVVINLCGNAVKFTAGGQVACRVEVHRIEGDAVTLGFTVVDSGIGIPAAAQARIFESFVQADSTVTREYGGTGLGLAICMQIVHLMQGEIGVDSTPGVGSSFRFTATFGGHSAPPALAPREASVLAGRSVLLVQGNAVAAQATARMLRAWNLRPLGLPTRAAALAAARLAARHGAAYPALLIDAPLWSAFDTAGSDSRGDLPPATTVVLLGDVHDDAALGDGPPRTIAVRKPPRSTDLLRAILGAFGAAPPPQREQRPSAPTSAVRVLSILVAEDHPINQKLARRILERRGHRVTLVADGMQAVNTVATQNFDVILMDVQMPVLDGVAATQAIRRAQDSSGRRIPIVALTAHALKGERERLLASGMDDYLSKPFDPDELVRMVERHGPSGGPGGELRESDALAAAAPVDAASTVVDPVYDHAKALAGALGDSAFLHEMVQALAADMPQSLRELAALVQDGDMAAAARAAHRLKGAVGNFHAGASMAAADRLESACDATDQDKAGVALKELETEMDRLLRALANGSAQEAA
jgi:PAS domain S-box-containing protein